MYTQTNRMPPQTDANSLKDKLWSLLDPVVADEGLALWDLQLVGAAGRPQRIQVFVDRGEGGISLDDCANLSRRMGAVLDVEELLSNAYNLEVSSPGIERTLHRVEHFQRYLGETVRLKLGYAVDGRRNVVGRLLSASEEQVEVDIPDVGLLAVPKEAIRRANLVVSFATGRKE